MKLFRKLKQKIPKRLCRIRNIRRERGRIWSQRIPASESCTDSAYDTIHSRNSMFHCSCCKSSQKINITLHYLFISYYHYSTCKVYISYDITILTLLKFSEIKN